MSTKSIKYKKIYYEKLVSLGCIICKKMGFPNSPAEIHHINEGRIGKRASFRKCLPLCPNHHRNGPESYHYSPKNFNKKWGSQKELLDFTLTQVKVLNDVG